MSPRCTKQASPACSRLPEIVILSVAKDLLFLLFLLLFVEMSVMIMTRDFYDHPNNQLQGQKKKQVLRCAQDDNSLGLVVYSNPETAPG